MMTAQQSKRNTKEKTIQVSVRVPESTRTELKIIAAKEGKSLNLLLEEIVIGYLKKKNSRDK